LLGTTAAMAENYECCQHSGYFQGDPELIKRNALKAAGAGWSLALHAIGDAAVDFAIETLEEAISVYGAPKIPHRIEHGGVVRAEQIDRLAKLPVVLVPQPYFIKEFGDAMAQKLGAKRVELSYPAKRLLDAGMTLPGSSDQPVTRGIPLEVMQAFAQRTTATGNEYGPADKITVSEALYAYTAGSAAATGWAGRKGQIKPGQLADFVLLGSNPLETPMEALSEIEILATVVGGELRYGSF
ncbi:amidohydrolase, partial [Corynebacterium striatum]